MESSMSRDYISRHRVDELKGKEDLLWGVMAYLRACHRLPKVPEAYVMEEFETKLHSIEYTSEHLEITEEP